MTPTIIVIVLVVGLLLLFTEVAVVPGFGVAGILGILALGAGAVAAWTELGPAHTDSKRIIVASNGLTAYLEADGHEVGRAGEALGFLREAVA